VAKELHFRGLKINPITFDEAVLESKRLIRERGHQVVGLNASKVNLCEKSQELKNLTNESSMVHADGIAVVWALRMLGHKVPARIAGIDLMHALVEEAAKASYGIYLLGARQEVVDSVEKSFTSLGARVVGKQNGYWEPSQEAQVVSDIAEKTPDILFIAIPSPEKEFFVGRNIQNLNCGLVLGVGGSFDVVAGVTKRAPLLMQKIGLEWLFRLAQEPRRLFKRYLYGNTYFIYLVFAQFFSEAKSRYSNVGRK